jgi:hypothetical protein
MIAWGILPALPAFYPGIMVPAVRVDSDAERELSIK